MVELSKSFIGISFSLAMLSGCGSEDSQNENMPFTTFKTVTQTATNTQQNKKSSEEENKENFTVLSSGEQPTSGVFSPKQFNVINTEEALLESWYNYSDDSLPEIDFEQQSVVLWNRGKMNLNNCGALPVLKGVEFSKVQDNLAVTTVKLTQYCQNVEIACTAQYIEGSPFMLLSVPKVQEIVLQEELNLVSCD